MGSAESKLFPNAVLNYRHAAAPVCRVDEPIAPTRVAFIGLTPAHRQVGALDSNRRRSFAYSARGANVWSVRRKRVDADLRHHCFLTDLVPRGCIQNLGLALQRDRHQHRPIYFARQ